MFTEAKHRIDSHILTESDKLNLLNMIECRFNGKVKLSLLYRMSKHGASTQRFHELCDNKGATLTVIKSKKYNHIFGGFTSIGWQSNYVGYDVKDKSAFLFLLTSGFNHKSEIFPISSDAGGVLHDSGYCAAFGVKGNCTLAIKSKGRDVCKGYVCTQNPIFKITGNALCGGESYQTEKKRYDFEIADYEVFRLSAKKRKVKREPEAEMTWRQFLSQTAGGQ